IRNNMCIKGCVYITTKTFPTHTSAPTLFATWSWWMSISMAIIAFLQFQFVFISCIPKRMIILRFYWNWFFITHIIAPSNFVKSLRRQYLVLPNQYISQFCKFLLGVPCLHIHVATAAQVLKHYSFHAYSLPLTCLLLY